MGVTWTRGFGMLVPEPAEEMHVPGESLRVLRIALELEEFTKPELAALSGVSYETVKKVLGQERGRTLDKTGDTVKPPTGRPSEVWRVINRDGILHRLGRSRDGAKEIVDLIDNPLRILDPTESALANAEDLIIFALNAGEPGDLDDFARRAHGEVTQMFEPRLFDLPTDGDFDPPFAEKRNVPLQLGRAQIVHAYSEYLLSTEAQGTNGPLWRRAFHRLASFDNPEQAALHKLLMSGLVTMAIERAQGGDQASAPTADFPDRSLIPGYRDRCWAVGAALTVDRLNVVLVDGYGRRIAQHQEELQREMEFDAVVHQISSSVNELLDSCEQVDRAIHEVALGVQLGGPIDADTGIVHFYRKNPIDLTPEWMSINTQPSGNAAGGPPMEAWIEVPLGPRLAEATGLRTVVENDANAFAAREAWLGRDESSPDFALMLIREGIGGSIVKDGRLFAGPVEVGNLLMHDYTPPYARRSDAGQAGSLEAAAGIDAIREDIFWNAGRHLVYNIDEAARLVADIEAADDEDTRQRAKAARRAFRTSGEALGRGASYLINLFGSTRLVVYGPGVVLDEQSPASQAFLEGFETFRDAIPEPFARTFLDCTPEYRAVEEHDDAHAASLVALERCLGLPPWIGK